MNVHVIYGQGGVLTSFGMYQLAGRIAALSPKLNVTKHSWDTPLKLSSTPSILVGYSLGANAVTWNASTGAPIELAVCYDPSIYGIVVQPQANIKRLLLYHNTGWDILGHLAFKGAQVETVEVKMPHLLVCYNESLHQRTLEAIRGVLGHGDLR